MNGMPVSNYGDEEQKKGNQQQAGGFRGIDRVAALLVAGIVLVSLYHVSIVRRTETRRCGLVLHYASSRLSHVHARFARQSHG